MDLNRKSVDQLANVLRKVASASITSAESIRESTTNSTQQNESTVLPPVRPARTKKKPEIRNGNYGI